MLRVSWSWPFGRAPSALPGPLGSIAERELLDVVSPVDSIRIDGLTSHTDEHCPCVLLSHSVVSVHQIKWVGKEPQPFLCGAT